MIVNPESVQSASDVLKKASNQLSTLFGRPVMVMFEFTDVELVTQSRIIEAVTDVTGVSFAEMVSKTKSNRLAFARYHVFKLMREELRVTLAYIAKAFGRDHTTVIAGLDVFKQLYKLDVQFRKEHDSITKRLYGGESDTETDA